MSHSCAPFVERSAKNASPIASTDVRTWLQDLESGTALGWKDRMDDDIEWMSTCPADGPLGQTCPTSGVFRGKDSTIKDLFMPMWARFIEKPKYEFTDIFVQPSEMNDPSERHLTKAVIEMKATGIMKSNGKDWVNYHCAVLHWDNETQKVIKVRSYLDSAAVNKAFEG
ncbi:hypothetical protein FRB95_004994 [Tulasnella sp. JGI-2019a]|nr:hypothetical protein FRB93_003397 [Tulasnella sp. JGI-2019a]KAG9029698.1 hypothetical protein FRB95_004994 [Tulasnella sp. JGI-2019a]